MLTELATSKFNILSNLSLITNQLRPAFMIQPIDYADDRERVLDRIFTNINSNIDEHGRKIFETHEIYQGILVFPAEFVIGSDVYTQIKTLISKYENYDDDNTLGELLGYPCAGDIKLDLHNERTLLSLRIGEKDIMSNICNSGNKAKFLNACDKMVEMMTHLNNNKNKFEKWADLPEVFVIFRQFQMS